MSRQKIILHVIIPIILIAGSFYAGFYFKKMFSPFDIAVGQNHLTKGYTLFLKGKIIDIGDNYIKLQSLNNGEKLILMENSKTAYYGQAANVAPQESLLLKKDLLVSLTKDDIKVGDVVNILTVVSASENKNLTALKIFINK